MTDPDDDELEERVYTVEIDGEIVHNSLDIEAACDVHRVNPGSVLFVDGEEIP